MSRHIFDIDVGSRARAYGTEGTISGNVFIQNSKAELIGRIRVDLSGRTKTKIVRKRGNNSRSVYRGRYTLFSKSIIINSTSTPLTAGQTYRWPFAVSFPSLLPPNNPRPAGTDDTLPPTFRDENVGFVIDYESFVEYTIRATIFKHQSAAPVYTHEIPVTYSPTFPIGRQLPDPGDRSSSETFDARSLLLLPENQGRELTLKEKTRSVFQSSKLPNSTFRFTVSYPTRVLAGSRFMITAGIEHIPGSSTAPETPQIEIDNLYVSLKGATHISAEGVFHEHGHSSEDTLFKQTWRNVGPFTKGDGWTKMLSATFPERVPVSFHTVNITRRYFLKVAAKIKCVDKSFDFVAQSGRSILQVYPRRDQAIPAPPPAAEAASSSQAPPEVEELPTYQEALSEPAPPEAPKDEMR